MTERSAVPVFARGLCDDAAMFPPGSMPLPEAVAAHHRHTGSSYAGLVGPLVVAAPDLAGLSAHVSAGPGKPRLPVVITLPAGPRGLVETMRTSAALPVDVRGFEVTAPDGMTPVDLVDIVETAQALDPSVELFVEIPRDSRRFDLITALSRTRCRAKFRTGGVRPELYPDETELAEAISAVVMSGIPFKATAGLHRAVRHTDPETGFEQHGFLNVLTAVEHALRERPVEELVRVLSHRDAADIATDIRQWDTDRAAAARRQFVSFGTCSLIEPLLDLVDLDLIPADLAGTDEGGT